MARRQGTAPKIQRGISFAPELYATIQADADRLGMRFNDLVESALRRSFLAAPNMPNTPVPLRHRHGEIDWSGDPDGNE